MVRKAHENAQVMLLNNRGTTYTVGSQLFKGKWLTKNTVCKKYTKMLIGGLYGHFLYFLHFPKLLYFQQWAGYYFEN